MYLTIDITGDRGCGKTTVLEIIKKALEREGVNISFLDSTDNGQNELLEMEVFLPSDKPSQSTLREHTESLIAAAARHSSDTEGNASMKFSQAALNCANTMMQLAQVDIVTK